MINCKECGHWHGNSHRSHSKPRLVCTECGGKASGEYAWADGSGFICDKCVEDDEWHCNECGGVNCTDLH